MKGTMNKFVENMKEFVMAVLALLFFGCQERETLKEVEISPTLPATIAATQEERKELSCRVSTNIPQIAALCKVLDMLDTIKYNKMDEKVLYEENKVGWKKHKTFYRGILMEQGSCDLFYSLINKDIRGFMCYFSNDLDEKYITNPFKKIHPDKKHSFIKGTVMLDTYQIEVYTSIGNSDSKFFYKSPLYNDLHKQYFHN